MSSLAYSSTHTQFTRDAGFFHASAHVHFSCCVFARLGLCDCHSGNTTCTGAVNPTFTQPNVPRLIEPEPRRHSGFNTPASIRPVPLPQNISPDLLTSFTRVIQPVLLNRCAAGACHGGRQSPFPQLDRSGIRTAPSRVPRFAILRRFSPEASGELLPCSLPLG